MKKDNNKESLSIDPTPGIIVVTDYDPWEHRTNKGTGVFGTYANMIRATFGSGMLSMPMALKNMGILWGPIMIVLVCLLCLYCLHCLLADIKKVCIRTKKPDVNFSESMKLTMEHGPTWMKKMSGGFPTVITVFNATAQVLILGSYILFIARTSEHFTNFVWKEFNLSYHIIFIGIIILISSLLLRSLSNIAFMSTAGNIAQLVGTCISLYYFSHDFADPSELVLIGDITEIPLGFGTTVYSLVAVGMILSLEYNMARPDMFVKSYGVLNLGLGITTLFYIFLGVIGYCKYGKNIEGTYIQNLPQETLAAVASLCFGIAVFTAFFIHIFTLIELFLGIYTKKCERNNKEPQHLLLLDLAVRVALVIFSSGAVIVFQKINLLIGLIGSFCMTAMAIVFPSMMRYSICCLETPDNPYRKIIPTLCGIIGLILGLAGTIVSGIGMVESAISDEKV